MAFYYCKSGGTATGDGGRYASQKANNSWATEFSATSEYYDSIESAMNATTEPVAADFIMVSSASAFSKGSTINLTSSSPPASPLQVYSVDDSAIQTYLAGGAEATGGASQDYVISTGNLVVAINGMIIESTDDIQVTGSGTGMLLKDSQVEFTTSANKFTVQADGSYIILNDTLINYQVTTTGTVFQVQGGGYVEMYGGAITGSGTIEDVIKGGGVAGGMSARFTGVDLSSLSATSFLLGGVGGAAAADDRIDVIYKGCKLAASVAYVEEEFASANHYFLATNCSDSSDAAEYQFFQRTWAGDVEDQDDAGIHRDESSAFPGGTKVSLKATTNSECSVSRPLIFDLPAVFADLSSVSTDTLRLYFAQVNTQPDLTDANCWVELHYPDKTTKNQYNFGSSQATLLAAGAQHTDDSASSTWLDGVSALTGHDEYRVDIALDGTDGAAGADSVPIIRVFIAEPSATIYFDTTIDTVP